MNADKLTKIGFKQKYNHIDAIVDLNKKFNSGFVPTSENWNLNWLLKKGLLKKVYNLKSLKESFKICKIRNNKANISKKIRDI